jgi:hypothetical protein
MKPGTDKIQTVMMIGTEQIIYSENSRRIYRFKSTIAAEKQSRDKDTSNYTRSD